MAYDPGENLLFALSAWVTTSWHRFRLTLDTLWPGKEEAMRGWERIAALRLLASLAHCDILVGEGSLSILVAPCSLAAIPLPGLPRAVLCGSRSPSTVNELGLACQHSGAVLKVRSQRSRAPLAPSLVEVQADSWKIISNIAAEVNITCLEIPPAWAFTASAGSVAQYTERLSWSSNPELNWYREDFDFESLAFKPSNSTEEFRLSRYRDPVKLTWTYRLWNRNMSAVTNPTWGRYVILERHHRIVLDYNEHSRVLTVPITVPLPIPLARALVLSSGLAPRYEGSELVYDLVPMDIANEVARKMGQIMAGDALCERVGR